MDNTIDKLQDKLIAFAQLRDWEKFQSPKNLSMALAVEASELMEHFQWLSEEESSNLNTTKKQDVAFELADVFMYTLLLARRMEIDIVQTAEKKIEINNQRYPADIVKGSAKKYNEYDR
ncbi:nucleotide pyrophosphohydrolase [Agarilytica rhodophyticola]|uniref:nucleotide pyrophosphohydrolase n=1 Tax=Agarilytica rhodophyticola TaxID=1737490 RepID=UPI000B349C98|nr:nucleotide pyrophosphohydrolase [Agarilytica rhodophyticola]